MPKKLRVYELAKMVDVSTKELLDKLKDLKIDAPSHMTSLEESDSNSVLNYYKKSTQKTAAQTAEKQSLPKKTEKAERAEKIDKSEKTEKIEKIEKIEKTENLDKVMPFAPEIRGPKIIQRAQPPKPAAPPAEKTDASQGSPNNAKKQQNLGVYRPANSQGEKWQQRTPRPQRQGERQGERQGNRPQNRNYQNNQNNQGGQNSQSGQNGQNNNRNDQRGTNRPYGDRPSYNNNRPAGDRPQNNGQNNRYQGDRPSYNNNRPAGDRPQNNGQNNRQGGNDRPSNNRPQNNRPGGNDRFNNDRQNNNRQGGRPAAPKASSAIAPIAAGKPSASNYNRNSSFNKNKQQNSYDSRGPKVPKGKIEKKPLAPPVKKPEPKERELRIIGIPPEITVKELAEYIGISGADMIKALMLKGMMLGINQNISFEEAVSVGEGYNVIFEPEIEIDVFEETFKETPDSEETLVERPPVVVVMGHVDHGKTSLLDSIRNSKVTASEAGGITQHIGAYTVEINGKPITFLDTPGHEAFTAMRLRGALITDIAVLVVAADDGVMPQTIEAINHAKAAGVEIIVAINKVDKPGANPDRVKQELTEFGLLAEDWGGETICVPVSAVTQQGIDNLLEMIILSADMKELRANPNKNARGTVIEAQLDKGRGPVATVLVQTGTLNVGDPVVIGTSYGKIRAMMDDKGRRVKSAGPSTPVEIIGLSEVPSAGDSFYVAENEKQARVVAETVVAKGRVEMTKKQKERVSLDDLFNQIQAGNVKDLNIVVKADVQGSVEAVRQSLERLSNEEVRISIIHGGVGTITESDVMLASASNAIIIGFNVRPEAAAKNFADEEKVDLRLYRVIYNAIEDITAAMKGMLDPVFEEKVFGHAAVRQTFKASGVGTIAGCYVTDGKFTRGNNVRLVRDGKVVFEGEMDSLRRFKDDVKEVNTGYECGIVFKRFNDIKEGDTVEAFAMVEIPR